MPIVTDYTALLSGGYWNGIEVTGKPVIVTYSFSTSAAGYLPDVDGFTAATVSSFQAFNSAEQTQARAALGEWAAASGLIFVEVAPGQGDISFQIVDFDTTSGPSYAAAAGIAFYPFGAWNSFTYPSFSGDLDISGDVFMNSQYVAGGQVDYGTLLHEIGHAIGLKHPTEVTTNFAANPPVVHDQVLASDDPNLTIMASVGDADTDDHLAALDQQAAAFLYGPAGTGQVLTASASGVNGTSTWSWNAAKKILTQTAASPAADNTLRGSSVSDVMSGLAGDDRLFGMSGKDTLDGGDGDDLLDGGAGNDTMTGGIGDDTYLVSSSRDKAIEIAGGGYDTVFAFSSFTLGAEIEYLQLFGAGLKGYGNELGNILFGDGGNGSKLYGLGGGDYMGGGSGKDTLDGGTGDDTMFGGGGNDTYLVDSSGDQVREDGTPGVDDGGVDLVQSTVSFTLGAFVENLELLGSAAINGTGNGLANQITGNSGNNVLLGGAGDDTLTGKGGADTMDGGDGDDTYYADSEDSVHDSGATGGDRLVYSSNVLVLAEGTGIENIEAAAGTRNIRLTGDSLANRITGNDGDNILKGLGGDDTIRGGVGNDTLEGGLGRDRQTGGDGADIFVFKAGDSPTLAFDTVVDFQTGSDRIDLSIFTGTPAGSAYAELAVASDNFNTLRTNAEGQLAAGAQAVFVAALSNGWLFWNTDATPGTADEALQLTGRNNLNAFAIGDLT